MTFRSMYKRSGIIVRTYEDLGLYPSEGYINDKSRFSFSEGVVLSAVPHGAANDLFYSEMVWITREEIRLLAALSLGIPPDKGKLAFYPSSHWTFIPSNSMPKDLYARTGDGFSQIELFIKKRTGKKIDLSIADVWQEIVKIAKAENNHSSSAYSFQDQNVNEPLVTTLFNSIDIEDDLLMRGLSCFLKGEMLICHAFFREEAAVNIFVALEAALNIIMENQRKLGKQNPSISDALAEIENKVKGTIDGITDYFRMIYDARVKTLHPQTKFGVHWAAPIAADDYYETYTELVPVYRYILTDMRSNLSNELGGL